MKKTFCPLCDSLETQEFLRGPQRDFWKCHHCQLIFVPSQFHLTKIRERERYELHQNNPQDEGYRSFLNRLCKCIIPKLGSGSRGLDFGSGPGPTLSLIMKEQGFQVTDYDPHFSPQRELLDRTYDFITCTETVEHFYQPRKEFLLMDQLLEQRGWLGIMTGMVQEEKRFSGWHYQREPSHVCFFRRKTMDWIAEWRSWRVEYPGRDVTLFQKLT